MSTMPVETALGVDDEELAQVLRLALPQLLERDGGRLLAAEARDARVHDATGGARRVVHEPPHLGFGAARQQREAAVARFLGDARQRDRRARRDRATCSACFSSFSGSAGTTSSMRAGERCRQTFASVSAWCSASSSTGRGAAEAVDDVGGLRRVLAAGTAG